MSSWHITESGEPGECRASKRPCPIGGQHFGNIYQAREGAEIQNALQAAGVDVSDIGWSQAPVSLKEAVDEAWRITRCLEGDEDWPTIKGYPNIGLVQSKLDEEGGRFVTDGEGRYARFSDYMERIRENRRSLGDDDGPPYSNGETAEVFDEIETWQADSLYNDPDLESEIASWRTANRAQPIREYFSLVTDSLGTFHDSPY